MSVNNFRIMTKHSNPLESRKPGRRPVLPPQWSVAARADHLLRLLSDTRDCLDWENLLRAQSVHDVRKALGSKEWAHEMKELWKYTENGLLFLDWLRERKFPRFERRAQMRHFAESIAAPSFGYRGKISLRRSRDLCWKEREHGTILRVEYYIECSCRYKGPVKDQKCPRCGAEIPKQYARLL